MLRGHGEIRRVSELSVEERVGDVVVKTPLTAIFIGEVVEVTTHVSFGLLRFAKFIRG